MNNQRQFKKVSIDNCDYLYPVPVIKEKKYLIRINPIFSDFLISALNLSYLESPDTSLDAYKEIEIHSELKKLEQISTVYKID